MKYKLPKLKSILRVFVPILVIAVIVGGSFYGGVQYGAQKKSIKITDSKDLINEDFSLFWDAIDKVKSNYVDIKNVSDKDFLYGAIQGVVGATKDPYTVFFPPSDAKKFQQDLTGSFGGIGAELGMKESQIVIVAPLKGNPAEAVGLKANDKILKVDDTSTANMSVDETVKLIRGAVETPVRLLVFRDGWKEAKEFTIVRKIISIPTLEYEMKEGNIAYIRLYNFNANADSLFYEAAVSSLLKGARGVVLDLRNNPGGFLDVAVKLAGWFVKRGSVVVKEEFKDGNGQELRAMGNEGLEGNPLVILVNEGSASASEILAGALRDLRGIRLVGQKTFGKGSVQEIQTLKDGSSQVKVTIAKWLTPNGHQIDKQGLTPDVEVKITDEDIENKRDPQLEKAIELLRPLVKI